MRKIAKGGFEITDWKEKPAGTSTGPKVTRATVKQKFTGDIKGTGTTEYLMVYREDGTATFVGLERIVGQVNGREGSFVVQHMGVFEDGVAKADLTVVPGAGTDDLQALSGEGAFGAQKGPKGTVTLDVDFG